MELVNHVEGHILFKYFFEADDVGVGQLFYYRVNLSIPGDFIFRFSLAVGTTCTCARITSLDRKGICPLCMSKSPRQFYSLLLYFVCLYFFCLNLYSFILQVIIKSRE